MNTSLQLLGNYKTRFKYPCALICCLYFISEFSGKKRLSLDMCYPGPQSAIHRHVSVQIQSAKLHSCSLTTVVLRKLFPRVISSIHLYLHINKQGFYLKSRSQTQVDSKKTTERDLHEIKEDKSRYFKLKFITTAERKQGSNVTSHDMFLKRSGNKEKSRNVDLVQF